MVTINQEFQSLIPPLTEAEYKQLEESILREGCREALVIWKDTILDGHHRYEICTKHSLQFRTQEVELASEEEAKVWIINNQLGRRNISDFVKFELAMKKKDLLLEMGREKMIEAGKMGREIQLGGLPQNGNPPASHNTQNEIANDLKWSHGKVSQAEVVLKKAPEEVKERLRKDDITISKAYAEVKKKDREEKIKKQIENIKNGDILSPEGKFDVIVIDPPWPYGTEYNPDGRRAASPYPEINLEEIKNIELPTSDNCILFLWTTHKFMRYSFEILDTWGFREVAIITWVKDRIGLGSWLRSQSEFCIMAVKGKPLINLTNQSTVITAPVREHSRKPDEFYEMVNSLCIGRKLDYFARETREDWEMFGKEEFNE